MRLLEADQMKKTCECEAEITIKGVKTYGLWDWVAEVVNEGGMLTLPRGWVRSMLTDAMCDVCKETLFVAHTFRRAVRGDDLRCPDAESYAEYRVRGAVTNVLDKMIREYEGILADIEEHTDKLVKKLAAARGDRKWVLQIIEDAQRHKGDDTESA